MSAKQIKIVEDNEKWVCWWKLGRALKKNIWQGEKKRSSPGLMMSRVKEETKTEREDIKTERKKPVPMLLEMRKYVSYLYS